MLSESEEAGMAEGGEMVSSCEFWSDNSKERGCQ